MRLLAIGPLPNRQSISGLAVAFEMAVEGLRDRGHDVLVVNSMPGSSSHVSGQLGLRRVVELATVLARSTWNMRQADIVYAPVSTSALGVFKDLYLGLVARVFSKPLIGHLHGGGERAFFENSGKVLKAMIRYSRRQYACIIVLGELLRQEYAYLDPPIPLAVVPNGLPAGSAPGTFKAKQWRSGEPVKLLYLSNMVPSKGYLLVLEACAALKGRGIPVCCRFCGAFLNTITEDSHGNTREAFLAYRDQLGLTDEVEYLGLVQGEQKCQVLDEAHIFVLPTSYPWEGQPISIIEAFSWGMPVVATRHKGITEQVQHGRSGMLVETDCAAGDIAEAVAMLLSSPEAYARYSNLARQAYQERFTAEAFIENLENTLSAVVECRG